MVQIPLPEKPLDLSEETLQANGQEPPEETREDVVEKKDEVKEETDEKFAQESDDTDPGEEEEEAMEKRSTVIILARTHPTEANTSFIVQGQKKEACPVFHFCKYRISGMMEFLTSTHKIAKDLRKNLDFIIFPMINPDGVFLGNTR